MRLLLRAMLVGLLSVVSALSAGELKPYKGRDITWSIDRNTLAVGETLQLLMERRPAPGGGSADLDLSGLAADFLVIGQTSTSTGFGSNPNAKESYLIAVVPKRAGQLRMNLPGLEASQQPVIQVINGGFNTPAVRLTLGLRPLPTRIAQRMPQLMVLSVCTTGALTWKAPQIPAETGYVAEYLGELTSEEPESPEQSACSRVDWFYRLTPTLSGSLTISPLPLEASHFGRTMLFVPPPLKLEIEALPAWLPDGLPLEGWEASWASPARIQAGEPMELVLELRAASTARRLEQLIRLGLEQSGDPGWQRALVKVESTAAGVSALPRWEARLSRIAPDTTGLQEVPAIRLPYWDLRLGEVQEGRVEALEFEVEARPLSLQERLVRLLGGVVLIGVGLGLMLPALGLIRWRLKVEWGIWRSEKLADKARWIDLAARAYGSVDSAYARWEARRMRRLQAELDRVRFSRPGR